MRLHRHAWRLCLDQRDGAGGAHRAIAARLAPGGLLYVSYNANPGWAAAGALAPILPRLYEGMEGDPVAMSR